MPSYNGRRSRRRAGMDKVLGEVVQKAVYDGIDALSEYVPQLKVAPGMAYKGLNEAALNKKIKEIYTGLVEKGINSQDGIEKGIYEGVVNFITGDSGEAFNKTTKKLILNEAELNSKAGLSGLRSYFGGSRSARNILRNKGEFYGIISSFDGLHEFFQTNPNAARQLPEIYDKISSLQQAGYIGVAAEIMQNEGLIDAAEAREIIGHVREQVKGTKKEVAEALKNRAKEFGGLEKIAASILGIFGLGFLLNSFNSSVTGNTIGFLGLNGFGIIGVLLLILAGTVLIHSFKEDMRNFA